MAETMRLTEITKEKNSERKGRKIMAFILRDQEKKRSARKTVVETEIKINPHLPIINTVTYLPKALNSDHHHSFKKYHGCPGWCGSSGLSTGL